MSNPAETPAPAPENRADFFAAMFASLVIQQTNMASILLGLAPNPQTGETTPDLENARYFIDQLEMLEAKTKGNLSRQEENLLKQSLTSLRIAFVEAVSNPAPSAAAEEKPAAAATPAAAEPAPAPSPAAPEPTPDAKPSDESKVKFTKKY